MINAGVGGYMNNIDFFGSARVVLHGHKFLDFPVNTSLLYYRYALLLIFELFPNSTVILSKILITLLNHKLL